LKIFIYFLVILVNVTHKMKEIGEFFGFNGVTGRIDPSAGASGNIMGSYDPLISSPVVSVEQLFHFSAPKFER